MKELPNSDHALLVRTDFSDESAWTRICAEIEAPVGEFRAYVTFVSDRESEGLAIDELTELGKRGPYRTFLFVIDRESVQDPEHPILVLDLAEEPGRTFRVVPREMWSVENNLSMANMDFSEFAENTDADGVFQGFGA